MIRPYCELHRPGKDATKSSSGDCGPNSSPYKLCHPKGMPCTFRDRPTRCLRCADSLPRGSSLQRRAGLAHVHDGTHAMPHPAYQVPYGGMQIRATARLRDPRTSTTCTHAHQCAHMHPFAQARPHDGLADHLGNFGGVLPFGGRTSAAILPFHLLTALSLPRFCRDSAVILPVRLRRAVRRRSWTGWAKGLYDEALKEV